MLIEPTWQSCTHLNQLFRLFEANGFQLYVVGGWVRDTILQKSTQDLDLATDATPQQIVDFIGPAGIRHKPIGIEFGSILLGPDNVCVTTFREDIKPRGRKTDVKFTRSLNTDARRRDFTINALYATYDGQVLDPVNGLEDLYNWRVRFIGDPESRIGEDYLRILRFFRFSAGYGNPERGCDAAGLHAISKIDVARLHCLSPARIRAEIDRLFALRPLSWCLREMERVNVWAWLFPDGQSMHIERLERLERQFGLQPDPLLVKIILGAKSTDGLLAFTRQEARHLKRVSQSIDDTKSPEEVAYLSGPRVAIHAHLAHSVLQRKTVEPDFMERIAFAAEQVFPLASGDLSHRFKGKALGDKLNDLKWDWIRSNFTLNKKSLLERAI